MDGMSWTALVEYARCTGFVVVVAAVAAVGVQQPVPDSEPGIAL
jgi:hypothetical protein